jgi:TRAP-type mannitol/chloroaromatic compound transport system permease large subunit
MTALLVFSALLCVLLAGVPVFVALAGVGMAVLAIAGESVTAVGDTLFATLNRGVLATIPLFVFYLGVFTATEAAAAGSVYALLVAFPWLATALPYGAGYGL